MSGDSSSAGSGECEQGQGEKPSGTTPSQKEGTQEGPEEKKPGEKPDSDQDPKPGQDGPPKGNREGGPDGQSAAQPKDAQGNPLLVQNGGDQWGNLPVHLRDLFRAEGGQDLPPRYRGWIDSYYRRLNDRQ